ncbi:MAG: Thermostable monoacylglycerol lipase [Firmicutes bacterium ADurb.Bin356]|nr:MAG: Thermostable monoacylglycerol lipase [Firmicutes bacterium ADurb.Bin356]
MRLHIIGRRKRIPRQEFDELASPFFHKGSGLGCLILHGFTGTPANVRVIADALTSEGHTVYAPLLKGHAATLFEMERASSDDWRQDALNAYMRLKDEGCTKIFLMGLSMGGLLMSLIASCHPCDGLVLMNTPFIMKRSLKNAMRASLLLRYVTTKGDPANPYSQGYNGAPLRKLRDLKKLSLLSTKALNKISCPILLIQSREDNRVDLKSVQVVENGAVNTDVRTIFLENSPHGCSYGPERDLVASYCIEFVKKYA